MSLPYTLKLNIDNIGKMDRPILERVKQRIREHGQTYKISELCLDELPLSQITPEMARLLEKCVNIEYLSLQHCVLRNLDNLPRLAKLEQLELGFNEIEGPALRSLAQYTNLRNLNLENNKIESCQHLKCLQACKELSRLYLTGNPLCKQNYRTELFPLLPQVQVIDGLSRSGQPVPQQTSSQGSSDYSDYEAEQSEGELQERESPTKMKRRN